MIIGIPKEIKTKESRVSVTPAGIKELVKEGHTLLVEKSAGLMTAYSDEDYIKAGAKIVEKADEVWKGSELIVKVKEPLKSEYKYFRSDLCIYTYLHLASVPELVDAMCKSGVMGIGYETVETADGHLPLLFPMSEVAGKIATQVGTYLLHKNHGGKGVLLGGVTGTQRGTVVVIGGGVVGVNAMDVAVGLKANVILLDIDEKRMDELYQEYDGKIKIVKSTPQSVAEWVKKADLLIGAVLIYGDRAPHVVTREMVKTMEPDSVVVDVSIDQGGCIETSRPTSHEEPIYKEHGVIHYCVPNMPALTPRTSTEALTSATFTYLKELANKGIEKALADDPALKLGLQVKDGKVTLPVLKKLFPQYA
ncbi:MAG: alanine dehydrogenase [Pseudomonadota bacterium]